MGVDTKLMLLILVRWAALLGYFGLFVLLFNWHTWLSPATEVARGLLIIVLVVPLLFPMRGILYGKPYTHAWTSFLALFYFAIGIDIVYYNAADRLLGVLQIIFSLLLFVACIYYPRCYKKSANSKFIRAQI